MRNIKKLGLAVALLVLSSCTKEPGQFDWLAGKWMQTLGNGALIEEWQKLDDDFYRGKSYAISGNDTTMLEQMTLTGHDTSFIYAVEFFKGKKDTFHLHEATDSSALFIDRANPFPKQILYKLMSEKDLLIVLEGQKKGEPTREEYRMIRVREK